VLIISLQMRIMQQAVLNYTIQSSQYIHMVYSHRRFNTWFQGRKCLDKQTIQDTEPETHVEFNQRPHRIDHRQGCSHDLARYSHGAVIGFALTPQLILYTQLHSSSCDNTPYRSHTIPHYTAQTYNLSHGLRHRASM